MGKKDITLNEFLGDPHIFADLLNGCFFRGRQEIRPEELLPMDSVQGTESRSMESREKGFGIQRSCFTDTARPQYWP